MKSELFTKIFESEKFGQIVVMKDRNDGDPSIEVHINPNGGRMTGSVKFVDEDEGWEAREKLFERFDLEQVENYIEANMWELAIEFYSEEGLFQEAASPVDNCLNCFNFSECGSEKTCSEGYENVEITVDPKTHTCDNWEVGESENVEENQ